MLTVGFIYNLKNTNTSLPDAYLEHDEPETIEAIHKALATRYRVVPLEANDKLLGSLYEHKNSLDIVFNIAEGTRGSWREAFVPMVLEELEIPYTGSDPSTMVLCLDKQRAKEVLSFHKIRTPLSKVFYEIPELSRDDIPPLEFPLIVKPLWEGSSKGIKNSSLVAGVNECQCEIARIIQTYKQPALVEEFIPGREFTIGVIGNGGDIMVMPIVEINFSALPQGASPIYSYEAKWVWDVPEKPLDIFHCPAHLEPRLEEKIKETAKKAYRTLSCRDWCRIDMRLDKINNPYILELNPIPGILPNPESNSCFPKAAYKLGWDYAQLINKVVSIACKRYGIHD